MHGCWVYAIDISDEDHILLRWTDSVFEGTFKIKPESRVFKCRFPVWDEFGRMKRISQSMTIEHFAAIVNYATTGHKLQGKSLDQLIISEWSRKENWAYVVLSRVQTLSGLFLTKPIPFDIDFSVRKNYSDMMSRLRREKLATSDDIADLMKSFEFPSN